MAENSEAEMVHKGCSTKLKAIESHFGSCNDFSRKTPNMIFPPLIPYWKNISVDADNKDSLIFPQILWPGSQFGVVFQPRSKFDFPGKTIIYSPCQGTALRYVFL